jgi:hypothetical protein
MSREQIVLLFVIANEQIVIVSFKINFSFLKSKGEVERNNFLYTLDPNGSGTLSIEVPETNWFKRLFGRKTKLITVKIVVS